MDYPMPSFSVSKKAIDYVDSTLFASKVSLTSVDSVFDIREYQPFDETQREVQEELLDADVSHKLVQDYKYNSMYADMLSQFYLIPPKTKAQSIEKALKATMSEMTKQKDKTKSQKSKPRQRKPKGESAEEDNSKIPKSSVSLTQKQDKTRQRKSNVNIKEDNSPKSNISLTQQQDKTRQRKSKDNIPNSNILLTQQQDRKRQRKARGSKGSAEGRKSTDGEHVPIPASNFSGSSTSEKFGRNTIWNKLMDIDKQQQQQPKTDHFQPKKPKRFNPFKHNNFLHFYLSTNRIYDVENHLEIRKQEFIELRYKKRLKEIQNRYMKEAMKELANGFKPYIPMPPTPEPEPEPKKVPVSPVPSEDPFGY